MVDDYVDFMMSRILLLKLRGDAFFHWVKPLVVAQTSSAPAAGATFCMWWRTVERLSNRLRSFSNPFWHITNEKQTKIQRICRQVSAGHHVQAETGRRVNDGLLWPLVKFLPYLIYCTLTQCVTSSSNLTGNGPSGHMSTSLWPETVKLKVQHEALVTCFHSVFPGIQGLACKHLMNTTSICLARGDFSPSVLDLKHLISFTHCVKGLLYT